MVMEGHNLNYKAEETILSKGDVVVIKGEEQNGGLWTIRIVEHLILGRDGVVRGVRLRAASPTYSDQCNISVHYSCLVTNLLERAVMLNTHASKFKPRHTATVACQHFTEIADAAITKDN